MELGLFSMGIQKEYMAELLSHHYWHSVMTGGSWILDLTPSRDYIVGNAVLKLYFPLTKYYSRLKSLQLMLANRCDHPSWLLFELCVVVLIAYESLEHRKQTRGKAWFSDGWDNVVYYTGAAAIKSNRRLAICWHSLLLSQFRLFKKWRLKSWYRSRTRRCSEFDVRSVPCDVDAFPQLCILLVCRIRRAFSRFRAPACIVRLLFKNLSLALDCFP